MARSLRRFGWMAHSEIVCIRNAIDLMASVRTAIVSCDGSSILVAGRSTLGRRISAGSLDDLVSLFCHVTLRHSLGISGFFRTRGLSDVLLVVTSFGFFSSGRPAVRGCTDVDMRHSRLPYSWGDLNYASFVAPFAFRRSRRTKM